MSENVAVTARRPRPRWIRVLLWTVIVVVMLAVLLVVADAVVRSSAEQRVSAEIEKSLPSNVAGDVHTHIGGMSVLLQYFAGTFEKVELEAPELTVDGKPIGASVVATGVPAGFGEPITAATGTLSISQSSLATLVTIPGATGDIALGDGVIDYTGTIDVLGLPVEYTVSATPKAEGDTVLLQLGTVSVDAGAEIGLTRLLHALTDNGSFPVCTAQYLPDGVKVSGIAITPGHATVTLTAQDVVLDGAFFQSKGHCS